MRAFHFGEGSYEAVERQLRELLREAGADVGGRTVSGREPPLEPRTPETYLGYERARGLVTDERPAPGVAIDLTPPRPPGPGEWTLSGRWIVSGEYVVPESTGVLELRFEARDVYLVIEPEQSGGTIDVAVDGAGPPDTEDVRSGRLAADESRLYHLARLGRGGARLLRLDVRGRLRLFAFTFG